MALVSVQSVSYTYITSTGEKLQAVKNVSFSVERGEYIAILGANGSGKSTLARLICGFLQPDSGTIEIASEAPSGIVFQNPKTQIIGGIVEQDTAFGPENLKCTKEETARRVSRMLEVTRLSDKAASKTTALSFGQTQKLALAGILALTPELLVLDEAVSMVDPAVRNDILNFISECHAAGKTIIAITHDISEALRAERVLAFDDGSLIADESHDAFAADTVLKERLFGSSLQTAGQASPAATREKELTLVFDNVSFTYNAAKAAGGKPVLDGLSVSFEKGTMTAVRGASGCGKSTMFELAAGLLTPASGEIRGICRPALALQECEGALFEVYAADDVAYGPRNAGITGSALRVRVKVAMEKAALPFDVFADRPVAALSGGEKRRVSLAGIIALDTPVLIFDEPCAGLDPAGRRHVLNSLRELCRAGKTVIYSTHHDDETTVADRVLYMEGGIIRENNEAVAQADDSDANKAAAEKASATAGLEKLSPLDDGGFLTRLRNSAGGAYQASGSVIHKLPPVVKYLLFLGIFVTSVCMRTWQPALIMTAVSCLYSLCAKVSLKKTLTVFFKLLPWLFFFTLIQFLFFPVQAGDAVLWQFSFIRISESKVHLAVSALIHLASAIFSVYAFLSSTEETDLVEGLRKLIPIRSIAVIALIIVRFLPLLAEEAAMIIKVQLIRGGLKETKGFFNRVRALLPLFVPLFSRTLDRAEDMADALTARYF